MSSALDNLLLLLIVATYCRLLLIVVFAASQLLILVIDYLADRFELMEWRRDHAAKQVKAMPHRKAIKR